jgi:hypothetical protein
MLSNYNMLSTDKKLSVMLLADNMILYDSKLSVDNMLEISHPRFHQGL